MKKMMLVAVLAVAGWTIANANEAEEAVLKHMTVNNEMQTPTQENDKRTLIEPENLPQGIKTALAAEEYTGWTVSTAYLVEPEEKEAYYEISLEKVGEEDLKVVKMDADGKLKQSEITPPLLP